MQRGFAFKLMPPKSIVDVLNMIGVHPTASIENIEKPTPEVAIAMYQALAEFSYDMDTQQLKGRAIEVPSVGQFLEIFEEALDVIAILKLTKQLTFINKIEDFNMRDLWDPQAKRLRAVLSGMINFCRYKESQTGIITTMKQEVQSLDMVRLELVDKSDAVGDELTQARTQHNAELQDMWEAESALQEAQNTADKLQKQRSIADRMQEQAEAKVQAAREQLEETGRRTEQLQDHVASLQEEIAESPEGLEEGIREVQTGIRLQKARVEEKTDEKRARAQRVHALGRVKGTIDNYKDVLEKLGEAVALQTAAGDRTRGAHNELTTLRSSFESRRSEEVDLIQAIEQMSSDMDAAKQAHEEHMRECEERRQQANCQHKELLEKRTEEQKQADALLAQRNQLEAEIARVARAHEDEMMEMQTRYKRVQESGEEYLRVVDGLISNYNAETGRTALTGCVASGMASPGSGYAYRKSIQGDMGAFSSSPSVRASPAPRRLLLERGLN